MIHILNPFKTLAALVLLTLAVGCASNVQEKENLLVSAGFKAISPANEKQQAYLQALPAGKVTRIAVSGKTYYVMPDVKANVGYVGGPKQYTAYQQLRLARQLSNENLEAAEMNQMASQNWGAWGGWGAWGNVGWY